MCFSFSGLVEFALVKVLWVEMPVTLLLFRPPFAFQQSSFVLALAFHRLDHHRQFVMGQQLKFVHR